MAPDNNPLLEIHRALGRIEGKQDVITNAVNGIREDHDKLATKVVALDKRVTGIDARLQWYAGVGASVMFAVTLFKDRLLALFQ